MYVCALCYDNHNFGEYNECNRFQPTAVSVGWNQWSIYCVGY